MKTKIKKIVYGAGAAILLVPGLVSAATGFTIPDKTGLPSGSITDIITKGMNWLLYLVGIIAVISFAISGILYLTAAGDEDRIKTAKSAMVMSIIGVVVALLGVVILTAVSSFLGGSSTTF
jgi:drug/metabolite transporter (DMT)-like permease